MNFVVLAQDASGSSSAWSSIIFLGVMVAVFYFLIIRPQRKRTRAQRELAETIEVGSEIRTIGGIHGTVLSVEDQSIVIKVEDGRLRISKRAVGSRVGDDA